MMAGGGNSYNKGYQQGQQGYQTPGYQSQNQGYQSRGGYQHEHDDRRGRGTGAGPYRGGRR